MKRRGFLKQAVAVTAAPSALLLPVAMAEPVVPPDWLAISRVPAGNPPVGWGYQPAYFGAPDSYYFYWWDREHSGPRRAVYNINAADCRKVQDRISANPGAPYLKLIGDLPGTMYANENETLQQV